MPMDAMRPRQLLGREGSWRAQRILATRHRTHMRGIHTGRVIAGEVVEHEAGRNRPDIPLVHDAMCLFLTPQAVALIVARSGPEPAAVRLNRVSDRMALRLPRACIHLNEHHGPHGLALPSPATVVPLIARMFTPRVMSERMSDTTPLSVPTSLFNALRSE